jgi:hypothetical protein
MSDTAKNIGYMRFGYSGTSGSNDNYIGFGFHSADDLLKIYPNRVESLFLYPIGSMVQNTGANPNQLYGGTWAIRNIWGNLNVFFENNNCIMVIIYAGNCVNVQISCKNYTIGNKNLTYNTQPYGFKVAMGDNWIIPMNYEWINNGNIEINNLNYRISLNNSQSFTVDSYVGNSSKNDYVLSFSSLITDFSAAVAIMPSTYYVSWLRTA